MISIRWGSVEVLDLFSVGGPSGWPSGFGFPTQASALRAPNLRLAPLITLGVTGHAFRSNLCSSTMSTDPTAQPRVIVLCFDGTANQFDSTVRRLVVDPLPWRPC